MRSKQKKRQTLVGKRENLYLDATKEAGMYRR